MTIDWSNPDEVKEYRRKYYEEHKEEHRKWSRKYRREHLEQYKNSQRRYLERHREEINKRDKKYKANWRKKNPEKTKAHNLVNANPDKYPLASKCEFCGSTENLEHGHIDYDYPQIYLTVCHRCNCWMDIPIKREG